MRDVPLPSTAFSSTSSTTGISTTYPLWHQLDERPHPDPLPDREWAVFSLRPSTGLAALEALVPAGATVGPVLLCQWHRWLLVPVEPGAKGSFLGERLGVKGRELSCPYDERFHRGGCQPFRLWLLPQDPNVLTDFWALAAQLDAMRASRPRPVAAAA